jgi:hypothetical protein
MKICILQLFALVALPYIPLEAQQTHSANPAKRAFVFDGVDYFHRWSLHDQHEFTPGDQEDLEKWSDMITVNVYPDAP